MTSSRKTAAENKSFKERSPFHLSVLREEHSKGTRNSARCTLYAINNINNICLIPVEVNAENFNKLS